MMNMNKNLVEMLEISGEEVKFDEEKERYSFGDGIITLGMENWYLAIRNPTHPEIFKVNGWKEDKEDFFVPIMTFCAPVSDKKKLLEQIKLLIRYISGMKKKAGMMK